MARISLLVWQKVKYVAFLKSTLAFLVSYLFPSLTIYISYRQYRSLIQMVSCTLVAVTLLFSSPSRVALVGYFFGESDAILAI